MDYNTRYLRTASISFEVPIPQLLDMWVHGQDIATEAMSKLGDDSILHEKTMFLNEGIIRQYFIDNKGVEHTVKIIQGPSIYSPSLYQNIETYGVVLHSQSLTRLTGRVWDLNYLLELSKHNPLFFNIMTKSLLNAIKLKALKDGRRQDCTAKEKYLLFMNEFPGAVNMIPLKYVASYLNMTPETLSRIRQKLSQKR